MMDIIHIWLEELTWPLCSIEYKAIRQIVRYSNIYLYTMFYSNIIYRNLKILILRINNVFRHLYITEQYEKSIKATDKIILI